MDVCVGFGPRSLVVLKTRFSSSSFSCQFTFSQRASFSGMKSFDSEFTILLYSWISLCLNSPYENWISKIFLLLIRLQKFLYKPDFIFLNFFVCDFICNSTSHIYNRDHETDYFNMVLWKLGIKSMKLKFSRLEKFFCVWCGQSLLLLQI